MIINRAIVSTDSNPIYYEFWPLVAKAWKNTQIEPTVAVIGALNLNYAYGTIVKMPVIEGISSGFIAQVIRLIVPCLFPEEVCIIGDIDMIPLSRQYFTKHIAGYDDDSIIVFSSDAYKTELRYPMCYIAAKGKYFQEIIGLKNTDLDTIVNFIKDLHALNLAWDTDELFFTRQLHNSALLSKTILLKRGGWKPFAKNRIDRTHWKYSLWGFSINKYIDAHCLRPMHQHIDTLAAMADYVNHGSDGKRYLYNLLKKPLKQTSVYFKLLKQNLIGRDLYAIAQELNPAISNKIISFSLYGDQPRYTGNLSHVIQSYKNIFPGWRCRVYVAADVAQQHISTLISEDCEVIMMQAKGIDARYTQWRFLAIEDKNMEAIIIRDLDSIAGEREKLMVGQWLASGKNFHIIRDHITHNTRIMAGMWGIKKNSIDIKKESKKIQLSNTYGTDQLFLEKIIYPQIKHDVMVHDSFPRFPDEDPVVIPLLPQDACIGEIHTDSSFRERDRSHLLSYHTKLITIS